MVSVGRFMRDTVQVLLFMLLTGGAYAAPLSQGSAVASQNSDHLLLVSYRNGLQQAEQALDAELQQIASRAAGDKWVLNQAERNRFRALWLTILDYYIGLDLIAKRYEGAYLNPKRSEEIQQGYAVMLAQYASALRIIRRLEMHPEIGVVLNEALPGSPLSAGSYERFKFQYLNLMIATRFAAEMAINHVSSEAKHASLPPAIVADEKTILAYGQGVGEGMTLANGLNIIKQGSRKMLFPVQARVSEWGGDTKVLRNGVSLINSEQIQQLKKQLLPGDILLERREWYLSNVGLPGFWSHAALYIGTPEERGDYFKESGLELRLAQLYPVSYERSLGRDSHGDTLRVLEAISEGVSLTSLEHSAMADSVVVLRPRLSKEEKARAIVRAMSYEGRPYDFNFDFQTDRELVCTELIYKAYQPEPGYRGLSIPLERVLGRLVLPANSIARLYDEQADSADSQFKMVAFLDGSEYQQRAVVSDEKSFRESWRRPKWHILVTDVASKE